MDYWQSIILGIVEGLTEFLPISSTAHLILGGKILNIVQTEFVKSFEIVIQLGAILAVIWLYWKRIVSSKEIIKRIIVAFLPTAIFGFLLYKIFKGYLMENLAVIVWALILGGILLIVFEYWHKEKADAAENIEDISYKNCFLIGTCQAIAMVPGVSRAGATILGGLFLGIKRKTIVEFSFLLAVPTMLAATGYDLLKTGFTFSADQFGQLSVGLIVSFLVAILAIKFLLRYIQQHDFKLFGLYRIIIGLIFLLIIL
ncbi:MAG: Undecaprenyl-diphosphatase [Candidatus Yanofskybacteria bacterium GW2011_GWF1_44_227]|uniref:Undecaprenyl-diphosphatase n=1 Tax=Candidatus Yanofskybacteria bacterium GW2011_GWE2_40_11 TaxID=1619033 RepID=A0A0G0TSY7_9BACT|nr:MAG: Undecaprenyl-diphosphatase [Candidatus Yanofskybacteria bacterium GW2011_GWE1_40_10]KKR40997.1 MAG: Undecaprenyl-diphosphatase [Candidatus Yanofskybacteria bacterium GW2011_GWE2_40_11]KKT15522.1 MAG: Undecaprenyl-diphosphatase [Candidatus Yanofskybacteria bacterium GW2011_GWF2_43_596]KKT53228.1 MAG: Undecaprenyl-diphosphatase [Candidatus Yanofskybacteria bacterium GW2011_GWF1_44_227]OGN35564.1 MAG: undecaprenyl-diphosphatase UppP [Candidatus Yanofskybacteria bacterium RIFOXYA1_FULL_44_1